MSDIIHLHKDDPDHELSPHFDTSEFRCKCCGELILDLDLVAALEAVRAYVSKIRQRDTPLNVTSGYRCAKHNKAIGGVKNSDHTRGIAADVATPTTMLTVIFAEAAWQVRRDMRRLKRPAPERIGCYDGYQGKHGFIHISCRRRWPFPDRWGDWG